MTLSFEVVDSRVDPHALAPTIVLRLRIAERDGRAVHGIALNCQVRIEPHRRAYDAVEEERLQDLFGERARWGDSVHPFVWTHVTAMVPGFTGTTTVDLPVSCTYDFDVAAAKYLDGLQDGEIPLLLLFSGTVFAPGNEGGFTVTPVSWSEDATYRLPVERWKEAMDRAFPNSAWLRVGRDTFDALNRFRMLRALPTWDHAVEQLLKEAGEAG